MTKRGEVYRSLQEKGMTYEEIGELFGVSKQAVHAAIKYQRDGFREGSAQKVKYVGLRNWLIVNRVTFGELERRCGQRLHAVLKGPHNPGKRTIDMILKVTGLTYEECFKEEEDK